MYLDDDTTLFLISSPEHQSRMRRNVSGVISIRVSHRLSANDKVVQVAGQFNNPPYITDISYPTRLPFLRLLLFNYRLYFCIYAVQEILCGELRIPAKRL